MSDVVNVIRRIGRHFILTDGERSILAAAISVAIFGALLAFNIVMTIGGHAGMLNGFSAYELWVVFSGAIGGPAGLYLCRNWMGRAGWRGFCTAIIGVVAVSVVGAIVGGTLALPFYGTMFGPFTLIMSLVSAPVLALLWASTLFGAHFLMGTWRSEQDSIFDAVLSADS